MFFFGRVALSHIWGDGLEIFGERRIWTSRDVCCGPLVGIVATESVIV